jgi:hypothetical protein
MAATALAAFLTCALISACYAIPDIEPYYLVAIVLSAIWIGVGLSGLLERRRLLGYVAVACAVLSIGVNARARFERLNQRGFHVATDWVRDALETVEPGSVVLTRSWDHYSPWIYLRHVKQLRPDVLWLDTRLIARSWYPEYIQRVAPERYRLAEPELKRLAPLVAHFEAGERFDTLALHRAYEHAVYALSLGQPGAVYVDGLAKATGDWGDPMRYLKNARTMPRGLLIRVLRDDETVEPLPFWPDYRNWNITGSVSERTAAHLDLYDSAFAAWSEQR